MFRGISGVGEGSLPPSPHARRPPAPRLQTLVDLAGRGAKESIDDLVVPPRLPDALLDEEGHIRARRSSEVELGAAPVEIL